MLIEKSKLLLSFLIFSSICIFAQELDLELIDINPGPDSSIPAAFDPNGSSPLIFGVYHPTLGNLLYTTDGTNEGTKQFVDPPVTDGGTGFAFESGLKSEYFFSNYISLHSEVGFVFALINRVEQNSLIQQTKGYKIDNTNNTKTEFDLPGEEVEPYGTTKLLGGGSFTFWFKKTAEQNQANHLALFSYGLTQDDRELWRTDGTTEGTIMVKDINNGSSISSFPDELTIVLEDPSIPYEDDGQPISAAVFFSAEENTNGRELWVTDGTEANTFMIKDIYEGDIGSYPTYLTAMGNKIYFAANDATFGRELWVSDGTTEGTSRIKDIAPDWRNSYPSQITLIEDRLLFRANDGTNGTELWTSDGTEEGTLMLKDIMPEGDSNPFGFIAYKEKIYFSANGSEGRELWVTDNSSDGTKIVKDIFIGESPSNPSAFIIFDDKLYFFAEDEQSGREIWRTDGTEEGTELVFDIYPGPTSSLHSYSRMSLANDKIYFAADDGIHGEELVVISKDATVDVGGSQNNKPSQFTLDQNYPNPFNPTTTIKYSIPTNSFITSGAAGSLVQLTIYDVLGREVTTLVNQIQSPGNYEVNFDASNMTSGIYYYNIKAGEFFETRKMSLLK